MNTKKGCLASGGALLSVLVLIVAGLLLILYYDSGFAGGLSLDWIQQQLTQLIASQNSQVSTNSVAQESNTDLDSEVDHEIGEWIIGQSVAGRPIHAYRWGNGDKGFAIVGGIHGGYEANTVQLANKLVDYFEVNSQTLIPTGVTLYLVPLLNPDGMANDSRLNANDVDLNRNWDCEWDPAGMYRGQLVNTGAAPFSEPETQALRDFVAAQKIDAILFYHSAHGSVSVGVCSTNTEAAIALARVVADVTDYRLYTYGSFFPMTGDATGYFNSIGIPAIEIELTDHTNIEWERNLAGILSALQWIARQNP